MKTQADTLSYGSGTKTVEVSSADRVLFPEAGLTKGDLVSYYASVARLMLPHISDRPVTMHRSPEGLKGTPFYQQDTPDYFPSWIERIQLRKVGGGTIEHPVCNSMVCLVYMANQGCITFHTWLSKTDEPERPDRLVFDLDPSDDDFEKVRTGAFVLKNVIEEHGLTPFVKITGSSGLHVVVPVRREKTFDDVRQTATSLANAAINTVPDLLTIEQRKANRGDRVYVDTLRNSYGQSVVVPYSVRIKAGAPVSAPVTWQQLEDKTLGPQTFHIGNVMQHYGQTGDPWKGIGRYARSLK